MRILQRLIAITATILVLFVLSELYLRSEVTYVTTRQIVERGGLLEANPEFLVLTTERGRRLVPNTHAIIKNHYLSKRDIAINTNEFGFRSAQLGDSKPSDEVRILFLGDSITLADSVSEEQTFVSHVQNQLQRPEPENRLRVINAGVGNSGLAEQINLLEDTVERVAPDQVVVVFYLNDSRPPWGFSGEIGDRGWWRRHSIVIDSIYRLVMQRVWSAKVGRPQFEWIQAKEKLDWRKDPAAFATLVEAARYDWGAAWNPESWGGIETQLDRLSRLALQHRFQTAVVLAPVSFQIESQLLDDAPQRKIIEILGRRGIPVLDLLPKLRSVYRDSLRPGDEALMFDQCHLTVFGNQVVGGQIAEFLSGLRPEN